MSTETIENHKNESLEVSDWHRYEQLKAKARLESASTEEYEQRIKEIIRVYHL